MKDKVWTTGLSLTGLPTIQEDNNSIAVVIADEPQQTAEFISLAPKMYRVLLHVKHWIEEQGTNPLYTHTVLCLIKDIVDTTDK
jgi:hypothetical protein